MVQSLYLGQVCYSRRILCGCFMCHCQTIFMTISSFEPDAIQCGPNELVPTMKFSFSYYYCPLTKLWEGNFFTRVYYSVHGGVWRRGAYLANGRVCMAKGGRGCGKGGGMRGEGACMRGLRIQAGSSHPTGMLSCFISK